MPMELHRLLEQYDSGTLNRRQLLKGLAVLASFGPLAVEAEIADAQTKATAIAPVVSINHVHFEVSNIGKSAEFYSALLGATPREAGQGILTMRLPSNTGRFGSWISLVDPSGPGAAAAGKPGTYNHVGYGVDLSNARRIVDEIKKEWPEIKTAEPNRTDQLYVYDPDGLPLQLMTAEHDGYIASERVPDGKGGFKNVQKYKPGEHIVP